MDLAPDLVTDLTDRVIDLTDPATAPEPPRADPWSLPRWREEARYTARYFPPPMPRTKRPAVPGLTILPELPAKRSRLDVRALLRHG